MFLFFEKNINFALQTKETMRKLIFAFLLVAGVLSGLTALADSLVLLHTNDTHSQLDTDDNGIGGVLPRKAIIDSIRAKEENVILIDAGDVVQGSLYFKFFRGEVEYPLMDMMDYDIRILGNHEFDNGIEDIAKYYKKTKGTPISANYDFSGTELDGVFSPYTIREINGKRIGFFGINVDPESLIDRKNIGEMKFKEIIPVANETAAFLKNKEHCDLVVAVTHIGVVKQNQKTTDYELAAASRDIDIIIGGHSHTVIWPEVIADEEEDEDEGYDDDDDEAPSIVGNADGRPVLVVQTGKYGRYLGYIKLDLDRLGNARDYDYQLIPVTDRFSPEQYDQEIIAFLAPYREQIEAFNKRVVAKSAVSSDNSDRTGALANLTGDIAYSYATHKADSLRLSTPDFPTVDFALMNVGGIRMPLREGDITVGQILNTYPFSNHLAIARVKGSDFIEAMEVAAAKGGESVSSQILVITDDDGDVEKVLLNGNPINPDDYYTFATIDYVLGGNDDLTSLANAELLWRDDVEVAAPILNYFETMGRMGKTVNPDTRKRFVKESD